MPEIENDQLMVDQIEETQSSVVARPPPVWNEGSLEAILTFIHDPSFVKLEREQKKPSLFTIAGQTFHETWHTQILGWLFDRKGSHKLGEFALKRLILLLRRNDLVPVKQRGLDLGHLLVDGNFSSFTVKPNEKDGTEAMVTPREKLDVLVSGVQTSGGQEVRFLIEAKVRAVAGSDQLTRYTDYVEHQRNLHNVLVIPALLAPPRELQRADAFISGRGWIPLHYRELTSWILIPCLEHPDLSDSGQRTLQEYIANLKNMRMGGEPMAITPEEHTLVDKLFVNHEEAIRALYWVLSESREEFTPIEDARSTRQPSNPLPRYQFGGTTLTGSTAPTMYEQVLEYLDRNGKLADLPLPLMSRNGRRILIYNEKPLNPETNRPYQYIERNGAYMNTTVDHDAVLRVLGELRQVLNIPGGPITEPQDVTADSVSTTNQLDDEAADVDLAGEPTTT